MTEGILLRISNIGLTVVPEVFTEFFAFVNRPVTSWLSFTSRLGEVVSSWDKPFLTLLYSSFLDNSPLGKLVSNFSSLPIAVLQAFGFNLNVSLWEFLLVNLIPISSVLLLLKFKDMIF